ncbi:MAG TPA: RsmB/NOP family class I SAM-dependent RNA methyltransferase [Micavibrio sp.]|nr:RsmB/NOP family class I SAM-dependent RNA methyltransferase [Micavibrio sp.]
MKDSARIASSIDLLARINAGRIPMDNTIRDFMAQRRFIGSKDRTAIVERVYRIMRAHARLGWWIARCGMADLSRTRVLADLMLSERPDEERLDVLFRDGKYEAGALDEAERTFAEALYEKQLNDPEMPEAVRAECPDWAEPKLRDLFGDAFEAHLASMIDPAPLDLRVNTVKGTVDEAMESLKADEVRVVKTPYSPVALRVEGKPFMSDTKAFRSGLVEIQDEGSQLIGLICGAKPGMRVLDFCAGGGGKTLVLAAQMQNKGNIVAMDNDSRRLEKGKPRYRKAGIHNVETRSLADEQNRKWLRRQKGTMDVVLVDAPCSSSGTWRRNPDLRWRWYGPTLEAIVQMQSEILDKVADKVKPGGRLVYATCSLFPEENERQVEAFIAKHPDYEVLSLAQVWEGDESSIPNAGLYLRLLPKDHGTDGFFAAVLRKS